MVHPFDDEKRDFDMDITQVPPFTRQLIEKHTMGYERMLLICVIHSIKFFRSVRDNLCAFENGRMRHDFSTPKFNLIYEKIATFWAMYDAQVIEEDYFIPREQLEALLVDQANATDGNSPVYIMVRELMAEMNDFYVMSTPLDAGFFNSIKGAAFEYWLNTRAAKHVVKRLDTKSMGGHITMEDCLETMTSLQSMVKPRVSHVRDVGQLLRGSSKYQPKIPCSLKVLNEKMGGGFDGSALTLIAGITGGGKTVLACQLALEFALAGNKVAIFTTEQKPEHMLTRMVANHTNTDIGQFVQRADFTGCDPDQEDGAILSNIPPWLFTDPRTAERVAEFDARVSPNLKILDWSQGQQFSIKSQFELTLDEMIASGFKPRVIIFDWIGGGLAKLKDADKLRLVYEDGANHLLNYAKAKGQCLIAMAQIDKVKAKGRKEITMDLVSECKTMADQATNFIGISALRQRAEIT